MSISDNTEEFTNKFYKDMDEQVNKNHATDADKNVITEWGIKFINDHPTAVVTATAIGIAFVSYKLQQRLFSTAIYKANLNTIDYLAKNYTLYKETL